MEENEDSKNLAEDSEIPMLTSTDGEAKIQKE